MNKKFSLILIILTIILLFNFPLINNKVFAYSGENFPYQPDDLEIINALNYLSKKQSSDGNIGGLSVSAWAAIAIFAADDDPNNWGNLVNYLEIKTPNLDPDKATDWERHALAIVACNKNPTDFAGIDFVEKIKSFYDGTQIGKTSILYDDFFGIISLISLGIDKNETIIKNTKSYIISKQNLDGGWGDADSTAAAIMALISSGENKDTQEISNALSFLKTLQADDGGFKSWGITNSASTSWAVMAITAAGKNPTHSEWQKNGNNPISYLLSLQQSDGSFNWSNSNNINPEWMTSYVIPALLGKYYPVKIYDSGDNNPPFKPSKPSGPSEGNLDVLYTFTTSSIDPDEDKIQYRFDWDADGNHKYSPWTTIGNSGHIGSVSNKWDVAGNYLIKSQARDENGLTSKWSDGHFIKIKKDNKWTGNIRIEGEKNTIWKGTVRIDEIYFNAKNVDTDDIEEYNIKYPSVLGAIVKASDIADFSITIEYFPSLNSFYIESIENESDWWHYWVDYEKPMAGAGKYALTDENYEILWGYLDSWKAHALKISIDKKNIKKNEEFTINVYNETGKSVTNSTVYVGSNHFLTDDEGKVTLNMSETGEFNVFSEKDGYIRSRKEIVKISKDIEIVSPTNNTLYFANFKIRENLKNTWIIGPIKIEVKSIDKIEKVEFYINGILEYIDEQQPFEYWLNKRSFFKKSIITVKSYLCGNISNIIFKLIKIIKELLDKDEKNMIFDVIKNSFEDLKTQELIIGDCETIESIIINFFPNFYKTLIDRG